MDSSIAHPRIVAVGKRLLSQCESATAVQVYDSRKHHSQRSVTWQRAQDYVTDCKNHSQNANQ